MRCINFAHRARVEFAAFIRSQTLLACPNNVSFTLWAAVLGPPLLWSDLAFGALKREGEHFRRHIETSYVLLSAFRKSLLILKTHLRSWKPFGRQLRFVRGRSTSEWQP